MSSIRWSFVVSAFLSLFLLVPAAQAQSNGEYDCGSYCRTSMSCDEPCTTCVMGPEYPDVYCYSGINWTTCGEAGATCGGCEIVNTWNVDEEVGRTAAPPHFCGGSRNSWGYVNWSVFLQYNKTMRRTTYGTRVCSGVSSTVVVSQTYYSDVCYDFVYPDCCYPWEPGCEAPEWRHAPPYEFDSYMECHD